MAGTAFQTASMVCAAVIRVSQIRTTQREHWTAAVTAFQKSRVNIIVFLLTAIIVFRAAFEQCLDVRKFTVADDLLMVMFNDDMVTHITLDIFAVDLFSCIFARAHRADVEIVFQDPFDGSDRP